MTDASRRPAPGEVQPAIFSFQLGSFAVANTLGGKAVREGLTSTFGGEAHPDTVQALAHANRIETARFEHSFIPTIVHTGKELVLFDTGNGGLSREHAQLQGRLPDGRLVERMRQNTPEDVVVITHGHPNHIAGLTEAGAPVFPNAR